MTEAPETTYIQLSDVERELLEQASWRSSGTYNIAGTQISIDISAPDCGLDAIVRTYLHHFATDNDHQSPDASVRYCLFVPTEANKQRSRTVYCLLLRDGRPVRQAGSPSGLIDALEWEANGSLVARNRHWLSLHAGVVTRHERAIIIPAVSGTGKTSLTCALLREGCAYGSDEAALLHPESLLTYPYHKPLSIKHLNWLNQQIDPLPQDPALWTCSTPEGQRIHAQDFATVQIDPTPVQWIVVPTSRGEGPPRLTPLSRTETLRALLANCFNPDIHKERTITTLTQLIRHAHCYALALGAPQETARLICQAVDAAI